MNRFIKIIVFGVLFILLILQSIIHMTVLKGSWEDFLHMLTTIFINNLLKYVESEVMEWQ